MTSPGATLLSGLRVMSRRVKIVAEYDGYVVVEKIGEAGEIAEQLDQRSADT